MSALKPFAINLNDLAFLLEQVNFTPLFDSLGNAVVNWDGATAIYDTHGQLLSSGNDAPGAAGDSARAALIQQFGRFDQVTGGYVAGFPDVSAPMGVRDVTGFHNNLYGTQAEWGAVDIPFVRQVSADYTNYVTTAGANYGTTVEGANVTQQSVIDFMPRIISRTITTGGVNLLRDASGQFVEWSSDRYATDAGYAALIDASGVDTSTLVAGAKIVAPLTTEIAILDNNGEALTWNLAQYQASVVYTGALAVLNATSFGGLKDASGGSLQEGEQIWYRSAPGGALVDSGQTYQPDVLVYKQLIDANVDFSAGAPADGTPVVTTIAQSGYGLLESLGQIDFQNPTSGEFFIGSENPGVAPVNSWFGIFGQFFDHGLDLIGKGGQGTTIRIALSENDPLYNSAPNHQITVSRATVSGADAGGDAAYVNHTSPFIDQSQTYGSVEQMTSLLREWVSTDNGATYHAGMNLLDGETLETS